MLAGCTKNIHRRKPRSSSWLERDFVHNSQRQGPRSQKREEKFDSYCLFHVVPDATLFKMFPLSAHVVALPDYQLGRPGRLALHKGEERQLRTRELELTITEHYRAYCRLKHPIGRRHFSA